MLVKFSESTFIIFLIYLGGYYNNWQPCSVVHRCKSPTSLINQRAHYDIDLGKENLTRPQPKLPFFNVRFSFKLGQKVQIKDEMK